MAKPKQKQKQKQKQEQTQKVSIRIGNISKPRKRRAATKATQQQQPRQYQMPQSIVVSNTLLPNTYVPPVFSPPLIYERNTLADKLLAKEGVPPQLYQPQMETATKKYDFDGIPEEAKKNIIQRGSQPADNIDNNITKKSQSSRAGLGEFLLSGASILGKMAFDKLTEETKPQKVAFKNTQTEQEQTSMEKIKPELSETKMEQTIMPLEKIIPQKTTSETQTIGTMKKKVIPSKKPQLIIEESEPVKPVAETPLTKEEQAIIKRREYQNARNAKIRAEKLAKEQEQMAKTTEVGEFVSLTKKGVPRATSSNIRLLTTGQTPKPTRKIAEPVFSTVSENPTPSKAFTNFY